MPINDKQQQMVRSYQEEGYAILRDVFTWQEIAVFVSECDRIWLSEGLRTNEKGEPVMERLDPVSDVSRVFDELNLDHRIAGIASSILGERITVMKEKLIYKKPGTGGYRPHHDGPYFSPTGVRGNEIVSAAVAIDSADQENGAIQLYPSLRNKRLLSPKSEHRDVTEESLEGVAPVMPELIKGDILFFDGLIPHRSGFNKSNRCRRTYIVTYVPARYPDCRRKYYEARTKEIASMGRNFVSKPLSFK